ncbi:hypothetical protein [Spiroplasma endosymbiont of Lasioglossum malachurum]|uniref:hypothetical protein n=1 Tax=Spiroplasma endosymbiont of Lasioglossum malachurum TaxID=3066319 RepID=UPI0030CB90AD
MKKNNLILSKTLVIISVLTVTISLSIFPLFNWGVPLKNNIAIIIALIVNKEPITSSFYKQLMTSDSIVSLYTFETLLIFNLTYLIPLIFIKKPFSRSVFAIHMLLITLVLILFVLVLFNYFNIRNFQTIPFKDLWTIPWAGIGLSLLTIFWYGLKNLWFNPPQLSKKSNDYSKNKKEEIKSDDLPSYEDLQLQLKMLKKQLKEVRNIKGKK